MNNFECGHSKTQHGFTLLEVLVVLLIMGIIINFAMTRIGDFGASQKMSEAINQFIALVKLSQQQALLTNTAIKIEVEHSGYHFYQSATQNSWQVYAHDPFLKTYQWPFTMTIAREKNDTDPIIFVNNTGEFSAFSFHMQYHQRRWHIFCRADNHIEVKQDGM